MVAQESILAMTLSSHAAAHRAPRRFARAAATVVAALTALLLLLPASAVAAVGLAIDGPPEQRPLLFAMAPDAGGVLRGDTPLDILISATNPNDSTVAAGEVSIAVSRTALATDKDLTAWLDAPSARDTEIARVTMPGIAAHGKRTLAVTVDPSSEQLVDLAPGVYPLSATYASAQGTLIAAAVLVVPTSVEAAGEVGPIGVIVPITAPAQTRGLLSAVELTTLTAPDGELRAQLDAVTGTAAILAIDPAVVAAIRVLGTSAPADAQQWLRDLMELPNSRFALQFGDADIATEIGAGLSAPLTVSTLTSYMTPSNFTGAGATAPNATPDGAATSDPTATPTPTTSPAPTPGQLPTLDELLNIGATSTNVFWPATGTAGADVVTALKDRTVADVAPTFVLPTTVVSGAPSAWAQADGAQILTYDAEVSAALRTASTSPDAIVRAAGLSAASGYASVATSAAPLAPLLVTVDRATARSREQLRATITAAMALSGRVAVGLDTLTSGAASAVTVATGEPDSARVATLEALLEGESSLTSFATILADPTLLTGPERASILQLIGNGWLDTPGAFAEAIEAHHAATATTLASVAIMPPSDITLLASSAPLAFSVHNELPWPVSLVLIATPNDPRLIVQNSTPVEAGPSQNTRVRVPVEARVGSGESTLDLQLRSPAMVAIGDEVPVAVAVRAEWESVGIVMMVTLVGGMLVLGVVRTVRRLRARGKNTDETDDNSMSDDENSEKSDG